MHDADGRHHLPLCLTGQIRLSVFISSRLKSIGLYQEISLADDSFFA
jgi:hypothetical protein